MRDPLNGKLHFQLSHSVIQQPTTNNSYDYNIYIIAYLYLFRQLTISVGLPQRRLDTSAKVKNTIKFVSRRFVS